MGSAWPLEDSAGSAGGEPPSQWGAFFFFFLLATSIAPREVLFLPRLCVSFIYRRVIGKKRGIANADVDVALCILKEQGERECGQQARGVPTRFSLTPSWFSLPFHSLTLRGIGALRPFGILVGRWTRVLCLGRLGLLLWILGLHIPSLLSHAWLPPGFCWKCLRISRPLIVFLLFSLLGVYSFIVISVCLGGRQTDLCSVYPLEPEVGHRILFLC